MIASHKIEKFYHYMKQSIGGNPHPSLLPAPYLARGVSIGSAWGLQLPGGKSIDGDSSTSSIGSHLLTGHSKQRVRVYQTIHI